MRRRASLRIIREEQGPGVFSRVVGRPLILLLTARPQSKERAMANSVPRVGETNSEF